MSKKMINCMAVVDPETKQVKYVPIDDFRKDRDEKEKKTGFKKVMQKLSDFWEDYHGEVVAFASGAAAIGGGIFAYNKFLKKPEVPTLNAPMCDDDCPFDEEDE